METKHADVPEFSIDTEQGDCARNATNVKAEGAQERLSSTVSDKTIALKCRQAEKPDGGTRWREIRGVKCFE